MFRVFRAPFHNRNYFLLLGLLQCLPSMVSAQYAPATTVVNPGQNQAQGQMQPQQSTNSQLSSTTTPTTATPPMTINTLVKNMVAKTACTPASGKQCEITAANLSDMGTYIQFCDQLSGWTIQYQYMRTLLITLTSNGTGCDFNFTDTHFPSKPTTVTCSFTKDQMTEIRKSFAGVSDVNKTFAPGQAMNSDILSKVKPFTDCLQPLNKMTTYTPNPNLPPNNINPGPAANPNTNPNTTNPGATNPGTANPSATNPAAIPDNSVPANTP